MALLHSTMVELGTPAPDFTLPDPDGGQLRLSDWADAPALLVVFMCNHCPYVKAVDERIVALQDEFASHGLQVVAINPNDADAYPDDSPENMKRVAAAKGYNFPYLVDASQEVARRYGAVCTPDFFLYGTDRTLVYRGRLDDSWRDEAAVTQRDLAEAIGALLAGERVPSDQTPSMGCSIKWKND